MDVVESRPLCGLTGAAVGEVSLLFGFVSVEFQLHTIPPAFPFVDGFLILFAILAKKKVNDR
jgi:hypothetical protein